MAATLVPSDPAALSPGTTSPSRTGAAPLATLRERVRVIEGTAAGRTAGFVRFGTPAVDRALPWGGLPRGALHEVIAEDAGPASGFCAALAGRLAAAGGGAILWCARRALLDAGALHGPGLAALGIDPARLVLVEAGRDAAVLWAMEEGLRCRDLAAVVGEVGEVSLTASRRLQLAAETGGGTAFALRPRRHDLGPSAALTRWRVAAAPGTTDDGAADGGAAIGRRWRAEMFRCRGGAPRTWLMEWRDETGDFAVAAAVHDRPDRPQPARLAG